MTDLFDAVARLKPAGDGGAFAAELDTPPLSPAVIAAIDKWRAQLEPLGLIDLPATTAPITAAMARDIGATVFAIAYDADGMARPGARQSVGWVITPEGAPIAPLGVTVAPQCDGDAVSTGAHQERSRAHRVPGIADAALEALALSEAVLREKVTALEEALIFERNELLAAVGDRADDAAAYRTMFNECVGLLHQAEEDAAKARSNYHRVLAELRTVRQQQRAEDAAKTAAAGPQKPTAKHHATH